MSVLVDGLYCWSGQVLHDVQQILPQGRSLPEEVWARRHHVILLLLWFHAVALAGLALVFGQSPLHSLAEGGLVAAAAMIAGSHRGSRRFRSTVASIGLVMASAVLVHVTGGYIEGHFHFFVVVAIILLYQDWVPFLAAITFVVIHHGLIGVLDPTAVYNHPDALAQPWKWAMIHGGFVLAASAASIVTWRLNEHQASHDPLTDLPNRALFREYAEHALGRGMRRQDMTAALFLDLDGFKAVNDTLGHAAGDQLLVLVAEKLRKCVRPGDVVARLGGDEFAVLLEGLREPKAATIVAERILAALQPAMLLPDQNREVFARASIGVAFNTTGDENVDQLLRNADMAMYMAKARGKGQHVVFETQMHTALLDRLALKSDLQGALERNELFVQYQPTVVLETGRIAGVEALVRWRHPDRGIVPPLDFIPLAEETGLIVPIGRWVLQQACLQARQWQLDCPADPPITVSVNISPRQLHRRALIPEVCQALNQSGLPAQSLVLEITESVLMQDTEMTVAQLGELKRLGVRLAIDDFGTGYSSLGYLQQFPIDILKIDKLFIDAISQTGEGAALVRTIIDLGRTLALQTVSEGIEDRDQAARLQELGCDLGQGFYFATPLDADSIAGILRSEPLQIPAPSPLREHKERPQRQATPQAGLAHG